MKYDNLCISAIRALVIDSINKAKSGHPGMALDMAPLLYVLYSRHLVADPKDPKWIKRDRLVLSAGHSCMALYATLHLAGYDISIDDLKQFRQLNSKTPGHPEVERTPGIDCSSGPLGQGIGQAVGMAIAERHLRAIYPNSDGIFEHYTYCICGDGCLEEGVSDEAIAYAGIQKLNKLILFYDANGSTMDGPTDLASNEDVFKRFQALGWNTLEVKDGNDIESIDKAINVAKTAKDRPTMIMIHSIIGFGSQKQGSNKTHGSPLGLEDGEFAKNSYGWSYPPFEIPDEVYMTFKETFIERGRIEHEKYGEALAKYQLSNPKEANYLMATIRNDVSPYIFKQLPTFPENESNATRNTSNVLLSLAQQELPNLIGGSGDVASSVKTDVKGETIFTADNPKGTIMRFGIREFGMATILNGMLLHGGLRTYGGSFMVFIDYFKAALRMAALQKLPQIFLLSHDSIAVGEDGPTHQPIEQLSGLRSIPNVRVYRPADSNECAESWRQALLSTDHPTCIVLTRQNVPLLAGTNGDGVDKGGYVVSKENSKLDYTIIASGSEVSLAIEAQKMLLERGIDGRVVSLPEARVFLSQPQEYKDEVLGVDRSKRLVVEMDSSWGLGIFSDNIMSVDSFGLSAPAKDVVNSFGFNKENVADRIIDILKK